MSSNAAAVLDTLVNSYRSDARKGEGGTTGLLSSADVAERCGLTTAQATRALNALYERGEADYYGKIEGLGNAHFWQLGERLHAENHPEDALVPSP